MSDVPSELIWDILVRLSAEVLLRLRIVCKAWLRIIDDSSFIKAHVDNQLYSHTVFISNNGSGDPSYSFSLDSLNFISGPQMIDVIHIEPLFRLGVPRYFNRTFCNGLILITNNTDSRKKWIIWNPLTKGYREVQLPKLNIPLRPHYDNNDLAYGFGYDHDADDYKVVIVDKLDFHGKVEWHTLVYSLKSNSWRKIEDCPYNMINGRSTFINGTLYWKYYDRITAFDLGTERFSQLSLPSLYKREGGFIDFKLDALDGCLIFSSWCDQRTTFNGWAMKDNGVEKSWIELFSLQRSYLEIADLYPWRLRLVAYLKRKEQVVLEGKGGCFLWVDIGTNSLKKFSIHGHPNIYSSNVCRNSLVRLNSALVTRKRKRKSEKTCTRLKFCVRDAGEFCCSDKYPCSEKNCRRCSLKE